MKTPDLAEFGRTEQCYRCKACTFGYEIERRPICPSFQYYRSQAHAAMGKVHLVKALRRGIIDLDPGLRDVAYQCTTCGACMEFCNEPYLRTPERGLVPLIEALRANLVEAGLGPMPQHCAFARAISENHNPYGEQPPQRFAWLPRGSATPGAQTLYFTGCTAAYRQPDTAGATAHLLSLTAEPFTTLGEDEWCCGSPLLRTGQLQNMEELARHNLDALREADARRVVVSCAGCYTTLTQDYPRILQRDLPFQVDYITEYLARALGEGRLRPQPTQDVVTYHDPCHLRHLWLFDPPREALSHVPGLKLAEMPRNREEAYCCGAGGGVKAAFPQFAATTARERVSEAAATGANVLLTSCPFCVTSLSQAAAAANAPIRVADITTYLLERCTTETTAKGRAKTPETLRCNVCGHTTTSRAEMSQHMLTHTTET